MMDEKTPTPSPEAPMSEALADKHYEQRRAGLLPPDAAADQKVLAARDRKAKDAAAAALAEAARRAARGR
jgi:hypothetical protein